MTGSSVSQLAIFAVIVFLSALINGASAAQPSAVDLAEDNARIADPKSLPGRGILTADDEEVLDDLQRRGLQFFLDGQDSRTGLMPDRSKADGSKAGDVASIASVGFGLTAFVIGHERGWLSRDEAYERCFRVLRFLRYEAPQERGHFYHFLDMRTGHRVWDSEVSNIDTALLMCGVLTVRQHFPNTELARLADDLYRRVEWGWLMTEDGTLSMGWKPELREAIFTDKDGKSRIVAVDESENGFIRAKWNHYSEGAPLIVLLAMGSPTHPLKPQAWHAWKRDKVGTYAGLTYIQCPPLFTHQFPMCWLDLRGLRDDYADYFKNSQLATLAQRQWCIDELSKKYPQYSPLYWGITASDTRNGYRAWGGPPQQDEIDGSVVPCAPAGSLVFRPRECLDVLLSLKEKYGERAYLKYGFVDALNPPEQWYNEDVIGIDVGPSILMAENLRTGFVWRTFMSAPEIKNALDLAGFRPTDADAPVTSSVFKSK